ncbi:hypothetical protein [Streptomyces sp. STCH 565 A]|uniref:hypothetical protein n=1 Tax=Streptomyces sp. STCH 565 A TaxID=2950532 RepID=UPI002074AD4A|nr:hypothetical protein [Streptomyces sp. STCH 565 A]MCM8548787.1 hypothetical protein [Streptomyces sp. STCH 565 A]
MALAMSWLAFVGIRGPVGDGERQSSVSIDTDEAEAAEQRDDEVTPNNPSVPSGWGSTEIRENEARTASPVPADASEGNNPSVASNGQERVVTDDGETPATATSPAPAPATSQSAPKKGKAAKKAPAARPGAASAKSDVTPAAKSAPTPSGPRVNTYVVPTSPESESFEVEDDEPSTWDNLGDFLGFFNPFLAALPPAFLPDIPDVPFKPFSEVGQTGQPDKLEKLPSIKLPEPVQSEPVQAEPQPDQPEAFIG